MTMITKEQAQAMIAECDGDDCLTCEYARTVIALHERVERLIEALIFCSGSYDFGAGGIAREGWLKLCAPLLKENTQTCRKCSGQMRPGIATEPTYTAGAPDFGPDDESSSLSPEHGPGVVIPAMKCEQCGWSVTK